MNGEQVRLSYDPSKFVDRHKELQLVVGKAKDLAVGSRVEKRIVVFHGARGAGKTWLLLEIERCLKQELATVLTLYLDLNGFSASPPDEAVRAIINRIRAAIKEKGSPGPFQARPGEKLETLTEALVEDVRRLGTLVLLFDHVNESPRDLLALLEDRCLSQLAVEPQALIVLAGRGKEYTWKAMELRLRCEECDLPNFDLSCTREQLEKQAPQAEPSAEKIYPLTAGYPWSNYIIGAHPTSRAEALERCAEFLLSGLPVTPNRAHLEALCVLRSFNDEMIPDLFAAYFDDPDYQKWGYRQCREARQALTGDTTVVRWNEASGGYVIDEAIGHVLENWLHECNRLTWERLHSAARNLFQEWREKYPRTASRWQKEVDYHDGKLANGPLWAPPDQEEKK